MADGEHSGLSAVEHRRENPLQHLSSDRHSCSRRLPERGGALAQEADEATHYLVAMRELARASFRRLDASLRRLTGDSAGNFATEFDRD